MKLIIKAAVLICMCLFISQTKAQVIENFETAASWTWSPWVQASAGSIGTKNAIAAHTGSFGYSGSTASYPWFRRSDYTFGNAGDVLSGWAKGNQRNYLGFGSSGGGCWSFVLAPNTSQLIIQSNSGWGYSNTVAVPYTYNTSAWYFLELTFNSSTSVTGRLYDAGMVFQTSVTSTPAGLTAGGPAMRIYCSTAGYFDDIGLNVVPLSIQLLELNAQPVEDAHSILLDWTTASEKNNDHFIIEKSVDGIIFESIGKVSGAGNSPGIKEYKFNDPNPFNGTNYYRLKSVEFDGTYSISKTITADNVNSHNNNVKVFPTVSSEIFFIELPGKGIQKVNVSDISGCVIKTLEIENNDDLPKRINLSDLEKGCYFISGHSKSVMWQKKVLIER